MCLTLADAGKNEVRGILFFSHTIHLDSTAQKLEICLLFELHSESFVWACKYLPVALRLPPLPLVPTGLVSSWSGIRKEVSFSQTRLFTSIFFFFSNGMGVEPGTHINLQRSLLVTNAEVTQTCSAGVRIQSPAGGGGQTTSERRCSLATIGPLPSHLRLKET